MKTTPIPVRRSRRSPLGTSSTNPSRSDPRCWSRNPSQCWPSSSRETFVWIRAFSTSCRGTTARGAGSGTCSTTASRSSRTTACRFTSPSAPTWGRLISTTRWWTSTARRITPRGRYACSGSPTTAARSRPRTCSDRNCTTKTPLRLPRSRSRSRRSGRSRNVTLTEWWFRGGGASRRRRRRPWTAAR